MREAPGTRQKSKGLPVLTTSHLDLDANETATSESADGAGNSNWAMCIVSFLADRLDGYEALRTAIALP